MCAPDLDLVLLDLNLLLELLQLRLQLLASTLLSTLERRQLRALTLQHAVAGGEGRGHTSKVDFG